MNRVNVLEKNPEKERIVGRKKNNRWRHERSIKQTINNGEEQLTTAKKRRQ